MYVESPLTGAALSGAALRNELTQRAYAFAQKQGLVHAVSDGASPSVIFGLDENGRHGNFHPTVYRRICARVEWSERLSKVHTSSRRMNVRSDWQWKELDCAHSSDALLMNVFCHPAAFRNGRLARALNIDERVRPVFGFHPRIPLRNGKTDQTEIDMKLGSLLVEAKLTEGGFETSSLSELLRYRDFDDVFSVNDLARRGGRIEGYQLVRGTLAAVVHGGEFCLVCDERRRDLIESAYSVISSIRRADVRCRVKVATWQEVAAALPLNMQRFLIAKYGFVLRQI